MLSSSTLLARATGFLESPKTAQALGLPHRFEYKLHFLGRGEYNVNILVDINKLKLVLRLNTASQMDLENQIQYEYNTLTQLKNSGVTPKPVYCDFDPDVDTQNMLLMEYIPGEWMDYHTHYLNAALVLAEVHKIKWQADTSLISFTNPGLEMLTECNAMANVFLNGNTGDTQMKIKIRNLLDSISKMVENEKIHLDEENLVLNNTEVNSSNFIWDERKQSLKLVDWEKAVFSTPVQDIAHFLVPTTTNWKTSYQFSFDEINHFLYAYCDRNKDEVDSIRNQLNLFWPLTCLRGITWCAMAWEEYQRSDRPIKNESTMKKIQSYLSDDFIDFIFQKKPWQASH